MRRWLALLVAATTSLVLVALLVPLALLIRTAAENAATGEATRTAESVAVAVAVEDEQALELTVERASATGYPITVFLPGGRTLGVPAPRSAAVRLAARGRSVTAEAPGGREILVAVQGLPEGTAVVRVFLSDAALTRGVAEAWLGMLLLGLALVGLGILVADRLARAVIRPVTALAQVSHRLAAGDLSARAEPGGPPEVRSVATALNHLADRIDELLAEERETVADISHRLRTPLTALRLEAESLRDPEEAARVEARVDALERAVSAVITDVRRRRRERGSCDAATVVADRVAFWSVLAEDQGRAVTVDLAPAPQPVAVGADDLAACVDALLGNVFAHTAEGTPFTVRLAPTPSGVELTIADAGPGFPPDLVHGALRRGHSGAGSTGLGLDIARRTAESAGGALRLAAAPGGGAQVTLLLPSPAPGDG
ncbi:two-component sensor histidine kinase [Thermopolyspora flexuosa]|uniref:Signal transduction histidine-protein kinase/phosphatase MprB n=1 Tax=Thermopolyspora flexuosa TaxID=103836 RepID=A0A543J0L1_9ACTN|nr:HAMP domain-containing sensor histidine kinase [Thermopolyspora flexuosa]TQM76358.1 signal transduction histidine kinase [Thermopolyspora flexuosa]GGM66749.1 two-component sensor histidine kinase [Thermopolyspora flexuosa]